MDVRKVSRLTLNSGLVLRSVHQPSILVRNFHLESVGHLRRVRVLDLFD